MTQDNDLRLDTGDSFPDISVTVTTGHKLQLSDGFVGEWAVVLFYRGDW